MEHRWTLPHTCSLSFLLFFISFAYLSHLATGQSRVFTSFDTESLSSWTLVPGAQQANNSIQLTSNISYSYAYGAAFWQTAQPVDVDFTISFSFRIVGSSGSLDAANNGYGADGISFIMSNSLPGSGIWGKMGYEWASSPPYKCVIVEFDTHYDDKDPVDTIGPDGEQQIVGPDGNHVGINMNGNVESVQAAHVPGLFNDGNVHHVWITYQMSDRSTIKVYHNPTENVQPILPVLKVTVPLKDILANSSAYFGFTAGSQSSQASQYILSMEYTQGRALSATSTPAPVTPPSFIADNKTLAEVQFKDRTSLLDWATNKSSWVMSPSVAVDSNGSFVLTVSNWDAQGKAAAAVSGMPVNATIGFSVQFDVQMGGFVGTPDAANDGTGGNGLALVLLPTPQLPVNMTPNGPGYSGLKPSVAIEFDTLYDSMFDPVDTVSALTGFREMLGPDGNHIGINRDGKLTSLAVTHIPDVMNDGRVKHVWVDYFAHNATVMVYYSAVKAVKPGSPVLAHVLNVSEALGGVSDVYIGFTAACSQAYQNHTVVSASISEGTAIKGLSPSGVVKPGLQIVKKKKKKKLAAIIIPVLFAGFIGLGVLYGVVAFLVRRGKWPGQAAPGAAEYKDEEEGIKYLRQHYRVSG